MFMIPKEPVLSCKEVVWIFKSVFGMSRASFFRHHRPKMKFFPVNGKGKSDLRIARNDVVEYFRQLRDGNYMFNGEYVPKLS